MQFLDLNLSEVTTDTLNNLSDISFSPASQNNVQAGGGFFSFFGGPTKVESAVLEAAKEKNMAVVEFMVDKGLISNYKFQDKDGNTLLHYLVSAANPNVNLIEKISKRSDATSFINKQNKEGETPLIAAVKSGQHDICTMLISSGADKHIPDKKGLHVETETDTEAVKEFGVSAQPLSRISPVFEVQASPQEVSPIFELVQKLLKRSKGQDKFTSEPGPMTEARNEPNINFIDTEDIVKRIEHKINVSGPSHAQESHAPIDTEETIKKLQSFIQKGGECGCGNDGMETEKLISAIETYFNDQSGGAKRKPAKKAKKTGTRKVKKYVESAVESETRENELGRIINNQVTEIIERSLKTIQSIISDNKKDFKSIKADEETARAIKAIIWKSIRDASPDKPALDIAVEMEKRVNKEQLKEISAKQIKDMVDVLQKHAAEKKVMREKKAADSVSQTSAEQVPSESNLSATSY